MRYMGLPADSVIILHMGGVYNDKPSTLARSKDVFKTKLTDEMRARLVMENDEMCYSVDDLLPVCSALGVPIVLDYHHNWINVRAPFFPVWLSSKCCKISFDHAKLTNWYLCSPP